MAGALTERDFVEKIEKAGFGDIEVHHREPLSVDDLTLYPLFAEGIAEGRGYLSLGQHPTAYYPPGYPFFLGGLQWILDRVGLGEHLVLVAGLLQALLGGLAVGAVVVAGARLGGRRVALDSGPRTRRKLRLRRSPDSDAGHEYGRDRS